MLAIRPFRVAPDEAARAWLDSHHESGPLVVAYDVTRCCGGGKLCRVSVRAGSPGREQGDYVPAVIEGGPPVLVDRQAAARLPASFGLTVRGLGPLKHLDLVLDPGQWGALLYD
jgi:hypothetical protein